MNKLKKISFLLLLVVAANCGEVLAQDPEFTQFYANPLYLNPAFAGANRCPRVSLNYRNQWPGISGSFVTTSASYDQYVDPIKGGLGILVMTDNAAQTLRTTRASLMYAYSLALGRKFNVNFGAQATYFNKYLDWSKLTFGDMIDPRRGFVYQTNDVRRGGNISGVDFSAGIIGYSERFFFGFAADHLTEPNESLIAETSPLPRKYTVHAGATIPISSGGPYRASKTFVSPNILFRQQGTFTQLNMGLYVKSGAINFGVWYRNKDAFIVTLGIQTEKLKIGYSYDVTISRLSLATGGAHEVSLGAYFPCKPKKSRFRTIECPSF